MCDYTSRTENSRTAFKMKPRSENGNTSGPNFSDGEEAENMSWSLSITNVPNDVYDDQTTKVSSFSLGK